MGFKSQLNHYQKMQLSQVKYLNDMADAFQNRDTNETINGTAGSKEHGA